MRFDPTQWYEVDVGEGVCTDAPVGRLSVRTSEPCALFVVLPGMAGGEVEAEILSRTVLVGHGTDFNIKLPEALGSVPFYLTGPASARAFLFERHSKARAAREGSFTNPDRPFSNVSEAYAEVLTEVRRFKLELKEQQRRFQADQRQRELRAISASNARIAAESRAAAVIEPAAPVSAPESVEQPPEAISEPPKGKAKASAAASE